MVVRESGKDEGVNVSCDVPAGSVAQFTAITAADLAKGQTRCVDVAGLALIAARGADGAVHVFDRHCSHLSLDMARGRVRGGAFVCPHHGAKFDMTTGAVLGPPASAPINAYPVRERDGWIEAELRP